MTYDNDFLEDSLPPRKRSRGSSKYRKGRKTVQCAQCLAWFFTEAGKQHHSAHHCPSPR